MAHVVNRVDDQDLVAFVRLTEGGTVKLHAGDTVPTKADADHVAALSSRGVLSEVKEPKGGRNSGSSSSSSSGDS